MPTQDMAIGGCPLRHNNMSHKYFVHDMMAHLKKQRISADSQ